MSYPGKIQTTYLQKVALFQYNERVSFEDDSGRPLGEGKSQNVNAKKPLMEYVTLLRNIHSAIRIDSVQAKGTELII